MKPYIYLVSLALTLTWVSCTEKKNDGEEREAEASVTVTLSEEQMNHLKPVMGKPAMRVFTGNIAAKGQLAVPPQDRANVTSPVGANIKSIMVAEGQQVRKGQVLAYLSHPDLIDLQGRYATAKNKLAYVRAEYLRQQRLHEAHVGAGKNFQQVSAEYKALMSEINATGTQLRLLGINLKTVEKGRLVTSIPLVSPFSGTVETVTASIGQYADPQTSLFSIVNTASLFADILVYESNLKSVRVGQKVKLDIASAGKKMVGKVVSVGKTFDGNSKGVHVRVALQGDKQGLIAGMYVAASISTTDVQRLAVSDDALASDNGRNYVFLYDSAHGKHVFTPKEVKVGTSENGYTQVYSGLGSKDVIAMNSAYELMSEWKKGEVGED
jgi:cobalt-zinc-cadmium efflux system membrane fusion protein